MTRGELWWVDYGIPFGLVSQIGVIDKQRLLEKISKVSKSIIGKIENNIVFILGIKLI